MFKNWKIRNRLLSSYVVIVILALAVAVLALTGLKASNVHLNEFIDHSFSADRAVKLCRIEANEAARTIRDMYINEDITQHEIYRKKIDENIASIRENVDLFTKSYEKQDGLKEKYVEALDRWVAIANQIMDKIDQKDYEAAQVMIIQECTPALQDLVSIAREIDASTSVLQEQAVKDNLDSTNAISIAVIGLLGVMFIFSVVIAAVVTKSIVIPVKQVGNAAAQLSKGILDTEIAYHSSDEIGSMADSMRDSMKTLETYIHDIDFALDTMASGDFNITTTVPFIGKFENIKESFDRFSFDMSNTLYQMDMSSDQVALGAGQVSDSAQALASGATEQTASMEKLLLAVSDITSQIKENADNALSADGYVQLAGQGVSESNLKMKQMIRAMEEISGKSYEIGKIIKTIDDIAFQTNILALNAAVEAARAGAAGKGFAVVADEVRSLAQKSAEAARNTTELIESTVRAVKDGSAIAGETAQSLVNVVEHAEKVTVMMGLVKNASEQQAEAAHEIKQELEQISVVIQSNSATAEESAAASEELSGQAQLFKNAINRFRLRERNRNK